MTQKDRYISKNIEGNEEIIKNIEELAFELSTNYCTTSFGDLEKEDVFLKHIFLDNSIIRKRLDGNGDGKVSAIQRHRNILIIGAGASHDSYNCIPLGKTMVEQLKNRYLEMIKQFDAINKKYEKKREEMIDERDLKDKDLDFENYMALFSDLILTQEEVRSFLAEFTHFSEPPSLFYEIAAHMFKHSFIDVIINFNFDELLDHAIEEELGRENYKFILNDGDCFEIEEAMVDGRLKIPIYIKPHGTVSNKSSLRFTKSHYLEIPSEVQTLISDLVSGFRGKGKEPINKINIISVGFNMESIEFNKILDKHLPHESKIFHFVYEEDNTQKNNIESNLSNFFKRVKDSFIHNKPKSFETILSQQLENNSFKKINLSAEIYKKINIANFNKIHSEKNTLTSPFSELFSLLWRCTENQYNKSYVPRSISRHEIISYLFYDSKFISGEHDFTKGRAELREKYENRVTYFRDRIIIEMAIAINRNKGIVDIVELSSDRAGIYYEKYKKQFLTSTGKRGSRLYTFIELVSIFLEDEDIDLMRYSKNIFRLKTLSNEELKLRLKNFDNYKNCLVAKDEISAIDIQNPLIENFISFLDSNLFDENNQVTPTLIYYVIRSNTLSSSFISNLKSNYARKCYNGKFITKADSNNGISDARPMLEELCRLLNKSTRNHYFQIKPKYSDRKNLVIESLSKRKILHTNLSLEYEMRRILEGKKWDRILCISEVGSYFHYLRHLSKKNQQLGEENRHIDEENDLHGSFDPEGKKIILLNSLDALYHGKNPEMPIHEFANIHNSTLFSKLTQNETSFVLKSYAIPFWQHNHHMIIFLKRIKQYSENLRAEYPYFELDDKNGFVMIGSFYMYRHGFSNHINPLYIGSDPYGKNVKYIENDFHRLLSLFFMNYQRAHAFNDLSEMKDLNWTIKNYEVQTEPKLFHKALKQFMQEIVW